MAKLTAPLLSMDATGSIGGTLTFAKWKGRNYVRQLVTPSNPQSAGQTAQRAMMRFLGSRWTADINAGLIEPTEWQALADQGKYSTFNAFTAYDMARWTQFNPPQISPETVVASRVATYGTWAATGGVRQATVNWSVTLATGTIWGLAIFRALGAAPTGLKTECIGVVRAISATAGLFVDTPLEPGTWHYKIKAFDTTGNWATALSGDVNAVVT